MVRKRVVQVKQAPLNAQRWLLVLECGHEAWVTAKRKPRAQTRRCSECINEFQCKESDVGLGCPREVDRD